ITGTPPVSEVVDISGDAFYGPGYEDSDRLPPDISKLRSLGWAPRYDLRTTIRDAMQAFLTTPQSAPRAPSFLDARLYSEP
ncbi:MAG TPA: hypothetical protein VFJ96_07850, partial [Gemmatimonadaceae bacterium]|nr:hypothetical protein [Gemmatimonadaceae bacterium]